MDIKAKLLKSKRGKIDAGKQLSVCSAGSQPFGQLLVDRAIAVSAEAHIRQYRKGTDTPYVAHPYAVGLILAREGFNDEVVAAGILHDVLEDTELTVDYLEQEFNERIAAMVVACSEPERSARWEIRKQGTIDKLADQPLEVRAITCADKLHNLRSTVLEHGQIGERVWERFARGRDKQAWYYLNLAEVFLSCENDGNCRIFQRFAEEVEVFFGRQ